MPRTVMLCADIAACDKRGLRPRQSGKEVIIMENPLTWGDAEKIVNKAYRTWYDNHAGKIIGLSLARTITDALREAGLLAEHSHTAHASQCDEPPAE